MLPGLERGGRKLGLADEDADAVGLGRLADEPETAAGASDEARALTAVAALTGVEEVPGA